MERFKSSENRLVRLFLKSRERWKENSANKQKKIRGLEVKVRDLSTSRDSWKSKALAAREEVKQLKKELSEFKKNYNNDNKAQNIARKENKQIETIPRGHIYPIYIIILAISQIISSLCSFRGAEKTFKSLAEVFNMPVPQGKRI